MTTNEEGVLQVFVGDAQGVDGFLYVIPEPSSIPEPSTLIIWSLLGALGIAVGWYRKRKS